MLNKDLVCSGQRGSSIYFWILQVLIVILWLEAEAVTLDKDLVCSGQSGSFRQAI